MTQQDHAPAGHDWLPAAVAGWPPWAQAAAIVGASIVVALALTWVIERTLKRWTARTASSLDDRVIALLHRPLTWSIVLYGMNLCVSRFDWPEGAEIQITRLLATIAVLLWTGFLLRTSGFVLRSAARQRHFTAVEERTLPIFVNVAKIVILGAVAWALIVIWEAHPGPWLASAGIVGIAVGFAAQDTLSNFFAGIAIIADAPYQIGDYVNLAEGQRGKVVAIGLRSTRILTRDDVEITIPNSVIGSTAIVNETRGPSTAHRVRVKVGVAYGSNWDHVEAALLDVARAEELILADPEPRVRLRQFGESGLDLELLGWIELPESRGLALHRVNTAVYRRFAEEGIEIPYPKRDLYLKEMPDADSLPG